MCTTRIALTVQHLRALYTLSWQHGRTTCNVFRARKTVYYFTTLFVLLFLSIWARSWRLSSSGVSSRARCNSRMPFPSPRAISGSFSPPKKKTQ